MARFTGPLGIIRFWWSWLNFQGHQFHITMRKPCLHSDYLLSQWLDLDQIGTYTRYIIGRTLIDNLILMTLTEFSRTPGSYNHELEDLKVLRRSPDLLNNVKIGQGQLQLIMEQILFYHIWGLQTFCSSDLNNLMNNPSNSPVISEKQMFR